MEQPKLTFDDIGLALRFELTPHRVLAGRRLISAAFDDAELWREDYEPVLDGPRATGDVYYEAVVADPDGNRLELTV